LRIQACNQCHPDPAFHVRRIWMGILAFHFAKLSFT
jgi:hypothetical protein